ncbi:LAFE_0F15170g1_1 [Lachancea fermentati]|uniref:DNA polymerase eta n=1 Tax=Lachancea fermentati TaxID=4955 RepID=A0A1G4MG76_LACFM|nr:LAFE_0F15170g1_1 [Lachancea fermentati]
MSKYKWRDLVDINSKTRSHLSALSCIAHIDANAFFAQVEQIRCHYTKDDPVVCVQWSSIIAVSYAARKYGITRMDSIGDALKKCDKLVPIHTAVFRKGEDFWQYHDGCGSWVDDEDKKLTPENFKVSLDPYRRESRKILKVFNEWCDVVEKASVDEVFLDLGRCCFSMLMFDESVHSFNEIRRVFKEGEYDLDLYLPPVPRNLDIQFDGNVYNPEKRSLFEDWDDVIFCLASILTNRIRSNIEEVLGYTTSCGIARTKSISKLASNFKKPAAQTIIKNSCIEDFLDNEKFEITSFWSMGGITGQELSQLLNLPKEKTIKYIRDSWPTTSDELKGFIDTKLREMGKDRDKYHTIDETQTQAIADKLFQLVRGEYRLSVNAKPMVKSMMSNKNLRGNSCKNFKDCIAWLEVFSGELDGRIRELEQEYNRLFIPKTIAISVRGHKFQKHAKSSSLMFTGSHIHSKDFLEAGSRLTQELDMKFGKDSGYYPLTNLNMSISNFEILEKGKTIVDMFGRQAQVTKKVEPGNFSSVESVTAENKESLFLCQPCDLSFSSEEQLREHADYHYALKLSESLNGANEDSKNLSYGERRLLFSKRKRPACSSSKNDSKRVKSTPQSDIYKFFK